MENPFLEPLPNESLKYPEQIFFFYQWTLQENYERRKGHQSLCRFNVEH